MRNTTLLWALSGFIVACAADSSDDGGSSSGGVVDTSAGASESGTDGGGSSSGAAAATGTVTLSFGVSNGVRMGPTLVDPLVGTVYGDLFLTSDVTITGPVEGAVSYASIALEGVDLTTDETASVTWTSEALPAENYTFLGMFDLDANFEASDHNPDAGDPVTLPNQKFDLAADQETAFTVMFELVYG
jgi:hypothetical protein